MKSIKQLRDESGMTQREVAAALGVTVATVSAWERRTHEPSARQLRSLARLFNTRMEEVDFERGDQRAANSN